MPAAAQAAGAYSENFDDLQAQGWTTSGASYTAVDGYYKNDTGGPRTLSVYGGSSWSTDYTYRVRLNSDFGASGNIVGAIYNYQDDNNFYEVWLNPEGVVKLNRIIGGVRQTIQQSTYTGFGADVWVQPEIVRRGTATTVRINGTTVFANVQQTELGAGKIGVITLFNLGRFDDVAVTATTVDRTGPAFPRIGTIRTSGHNYEDPTVQQEIARAHVAVLSYFKGWNNSRRNMNQVIQNIKDLSVHTDVRTKVLLYTNNGEFNDNPGFPDTSNPELTDKINEMDWWLMKDGVPVPSNYKPDLFTLVNITPFVPRDSSGMTWAQWYANWTYTNIFLPNSNADGLYADNVGWAARADGDWNCDGSTDLATSPAAGSWYRQGFRQQFDAWRSLLPAGKLVTGNIGSWGQSQATITPEYPGILDGGTLENMIGPSDQDLETWAGWQEVLRRYRIIMAATKGQKLVIFMQGGAATDYRGMRYGLGTALLDDGYFAYAIFENDAEGKPIRVYKTTPWFDEYSANLGYPTTPPPTTEWQNRVYRRDFENGIVLVNPKGSGTRTVTVGPGFRHINGTQDPIVNNGQPVTTVTLQERDGVILLRE